MSSCRPVSVFDAFVLSSCDITCWLPLWLQPLIGGLCPFLCRPDMHRAELYHQGRQSAGCCRARPHHRGSGHQPTYECAHTRSVCLQGSPGFGMVVTAVALPSGGCGIEGEDESWDFGTGAGFYVDATQDPWKTNYRMYSYVTEELPKLINANFPTHPDRISISGHSMGGHGALICALKNPGKYKVPSPPHQTILSFGCLWVMNSSVTFFEESAKANFRFLLTMPTFLIKS